MPTYSDPGYIADVVGTSGRIEATWGNAVRDRLVHRFASVAARDAAITFPSEGMCCYVTAENAFYMHDGTRWLAWDNQLHAYTSSLAWIGGGGAIGNGSLVPVFQRKGDLCLMKCQLIWGSSTTAGVGALVLGLPFQAHGSYRSYGVGFVTDASPTNEYPVIVKVDNSATGAYCYTTVSPGVAVANAAPITFATSDEVAMQVEYVRAAYGADETT